MLVTDLDSNLILLFPIMDGDVVVSASVRCCDWIARTGRLMESRRHLAPGSEAGTLRAWHQHPLGIQ